VCDFFERRTILIDIKVKSLDKTSRGAMERDTLLMTYESDAVTEPESCSICMEQLHTGQQVRSIAGCVHTFHAGCVETWLAQKPACPLCRYLLPTLGAEMREELYYRDLRLLYERLQAYTPPPARETVERYLLTYTLINGILKRFPGSMGEGGLLAAVETIRGRVGNLEVGGHRPFPFEVRSLYGLRKLLRGLAAYLANHFSCSPLRVSRLPALADWKGLVGAAAGIEAIWLTF
jgi:hypothetical protein